MIYAIQLRPRAMRDLEGLSPEVRKRILAKLNVLKLDLTGDVKRLVRHSPQFRLRVGDWRVLFEVEAGIVTVYRVLHRSKAYD